jgi:C4-dicarboxylate-specific signal transduction histidine kinase
MTFQVAATRVPALSVGAWDPLPQYASALELLALGLTVGGVAYFARVFAEASRAQERARREADTLLALSLEGLDVSLEVVERGQVAWQNAGATALLGQRRGESWRCPAVDAACTRGACPAHAAASQSVRCTVKLNSEDPDARVFEMLRLPLGEAADERSMVLYLDRTVELRSQRQWVLTERLASLGRTVQGVAHELNTPLSTIRLLARDLEQALELVRGSEAIARSRALAQEFARDAADALSWLPPSECRGALLQLPEFVLSRLY